MNDNIKHIPILELEDMVDSKIISKASWADLWTPTTAVTTEEWATRFRVMTNSDGNQHGRFLNKFDIKRCPVIREPMRSLDSKHTRMVVIKAATQSGKSQLAMNLLGKKVSQGTQLLLLVPTINLVKTVWQRYDSMINNCPSLKKLKTPRKWSQGSYNFAGGRIIVNSSNSTTAIISHSVDTVIFDEVSTSDESQIKGTVFDGIQSRLKQYAGSSKLLFVSSPKDEGTILETAYNACEITLEYHIKCPSCGRYFPPGTECINFNKNKWDIEASKYRPWSGQYKARVREHSTFNCPQCGIVISDRERARLLQDGVFLDVNDDFFTHDFTEESVGYTWSALSNPETPASVYAVNLAGSKQSFDSRMAFTNESEGKTFYTLSSQATNTVHLFPLIGDTPRGIIKDNTIGVVAGIDCQRNRFYGIKMAIEREDDNSYQYRIIDNVEVARTQTGVSGFTLLDSWLDLPVWFEDGQRGAFVSRVAIDSGGASNEDLGEDQLSSTDLVRQWVANRNATSKTMVTFAVLGRGNVKQEVQLTNMNPSFDGKIIPVNGQYLRSYNIKSDYFKNEIMVLLDHDNLELNPIKFYKDVDQELLQHMVAERRVKQKTGKYKWQNKGDRSRNDFYDCLVYAVASLHKKFDLGILAIEPLFRKTIIRGNPETGVVTPKIIFKPRKEDDADENVKPSGFIGSVRDKHGRLTWNKR